MKTLAIFCRSLSTMLNSGVDIKKALDVAGSKSGNPRCKTAVKEIVLLVRQGEDLSAAMKEQGDAFPDIMIEMVGVGEESGALPEILLGLADHYENNISLRKNFIKTIAWPVIQLMLAIPLIAFILYIGGFILESFGDLLKFEVPSLFGVKLLGGDAAVLWLFIAYGTLAGIIVLYFLGKRTFFGERLLDPLLMQVPVVGSCMRAFAVARFSWAFYLTQQTGMPIHNSLDSSLRATGNGLFLSASPMMQRQLKEGEGLVEVFEKSGLFPAEFIEMAAVAEASGTVPEALHRMSPQFEEDARRKLTQLANLVGVIVWVGIAALIVTVVIGAVVAYASVISELSQGL